MPAPRITWKSQTRRNGIISVEGIVTGNPSSVKVDLPADPVNPNGAVNRPQGTAVVNSINGEFMCEFPMTNSTAGNYAAAKITATNSDGETVAYSVPMTWYANGAQPIGTPVVLFPPFTPPAFTAPSVALNAKVTDVTLVSTAAADQPNMPFSFGQVFAAGALAPNNFLVGRVAGEADIPLQFNVKATHPDGSVAHGMISGRTTLAAGAAKTIDIIRAASSTLTTTTGQSAGLINGFNITARIVANGVTYTADPKPFIDSNGPFDTVWIKGTLCNEYILNLPFKDASGNEHPFLTAQFNVRAYHATSFVRVDVAFEHCKAFVAINEITYNAAILRGTAVVYEKIGLVHRPAARFKKRVWTGAVPEYFVQHNRPYFTASKAVPNWNLEWTIPTNEITKWGNVGTSAFEPMNHGLLTRGMGTAGGRGDIGVVAMYAAGALMTGNGPALNGMFVHTDICAGAWGTHQRDTGPGPNKGRPLTTVYYPRVSHIGTSADRKNAATGMVEALSNSHYGADTSHQPSMAYLPYLMTCDFYYLEEQLFWCNATIHLHNPGYRKSHRAVTHGQLRAQAWTIRTLGQSAFACPDDHPEKQAYRFYLDNNLSSYNAEYTDNPNANKLGLIDSDTVYDSGYDANGVALVDNAQSCFQEDHFTTAVSHVAELGFTESARLASWKAKYIMGRMLGSGFCYIRAGNYRLRVKETKDSPVYENFGQVYEGTFRELGSGYFSLPCGSQEQLDWLNANRELPSNAYVLGQFLGDTVTMQPALAFATDFGRMPNRDVAWFTFINRPKRAGYDVGTQHWVMPRTDGLAVDPLYPVEPPYLPPTDPIDPPVDPEDPPPVSTAPTDTYVGLFGSTLYFGRNA